MATESHALVTLDEVKTQLGLGEGREFDRLLQERADLATALVIDYIKRPAHGWSTSTNPNSDIEFMRVKGAILTLTCELFRHRGDDDEDAPTERAISLYLPARVERILYSLRDPTLA